MPRKSFGVAVAAEPISFDIDCPVRGPQNFRCRDRMSAGSLMRFAELFANMADDPNSPENASSGADAIPAVKDFFNSALMPEARERFWAVIYDDDEGIPMETLVDIAGWLAEVYAGDRPTGPTSSGTSAGTSTGGASSATEPPADTQIYSRSEPTPVSA